MRNILFAMIVILTSLSLVGQKTEKKSSVKTRPDYTAIDSDLQPFVNEYKALAEQHNIKFTNSITAGFTTLNYGRAVGLCTYQKTFREIDIDESYWMKIGSEQKKMLIFHELTHCLCTRSHDYGAGEDYPDDKLENLLDVLHKRNPKAFFETQPGFYEDNCPLSIMHPVVVSEKCIQAHQDEYLEEMFNRCRPY